MQNTNVVEMGGNMDEWYLKSEESEHEVRT
jgi:hypothetical protein